MDEISDADNEGSVRQLARAVVLNLHALIIRELNLPHDRIMVPRSSWSRVTEFDIQLMDARLRISALRYSPHRHATSRADTASKQALKHQSAPPSAIRQCLCLNSPADCSYRCCSRSTLIPQAVSATLRWLECLDLREGETC